MRLADHSYEVLVLVCVNEREDVKACCAQKGSLVLYEHIKSAIRKQEEDFPDSRKKIRVSKTGCLGNCSSGITVAIMPDNLYFGEVAEKDVKEIVELVMKKVR